MLKPPFPLNQLALSVKLICKYWHRPQAVEDPRIGPAIRNNTVARNLLRLGKTK